METRFNFSTNTTQDGPIQLQRKITLAFPDNENVHILCNVRYTSVCEDGTLYLVQLGSATLSSVTKRKELDLFPSSFEKNENAYSVGFTKIKLIAIISLLGYHIGKLVRCEKSINPVRVEMDL